MACMRTITLFDYAVVSKLYSAKRSLTQLF